MRCSNIEEACIATLVVAGQVSLLSKPTQELIYGIVKNLETLVWATISGSGLLKIRIDIAFPIRRLTSRFSRPVFSAMCPKEIWPPGGIISGIWYRQIASMLTRLEIFEALAINKVHLGPSKPYRSEFVDQHQGLQKQLMQFSSCVEDSILKIRHISWEALWTVFGPRWGWRALGCQLLLQLSDRSADLSSQLDDSGHVVG